VSPFELLTYALATWYLSYIITAQDGPFLVLKRIRAMPLFFAVLQCIYCTAPYVAGVVYLVSRNTEYGLPIVQVVAVAGAALMLRAYTGAGLHDGL
jgi:hypothetical protein